MGGSVDTARQPGGDDDTALPERGSEIPTEPPAIG